MWKNIQNAIRGSLIELNRIAQLAQIREFSLLNSRSLPSSNIEQTASSLRLVTAFYGVGKEFFLNKSKSSTAKKPFSFGDDSW